MSEPKHNRGRSKQDYQTPPEFLEAVLRKWRLGDFDCDLAASPENAVCSTYYTVRDDALTQPWRMGQGYNWLNPPFADIRPWVRKAYLEMASRGARTLVLVPAGVGANWFRDWVFGRAHVWFLNGRLTFVGCPTCYPKDLMLLDYGSRTPGFDIWSWRSR